MIVLSWPGLVGVYRRASCFLETQLATERTVRMFFRHAKGLRGRRRKQTKRERERGTDKEGEGEGESVSGPGFLREKSESEWETSRRCMCEWIIEEVSVCEGVWVRVYVSLQYTQIKWLGCLVQTCSKRVSSTSKKRGTRTNSFTR